MVADILMKPDINKRRKVELLEEEEEKSTADYDYISGFPDHILHEILSYLHYDDIVRTSCLSKRWRYLWASRPRLSFQIDDMNSLSERNTYQGVADQQVDNPDSRKRRARRLVNSVNQVLSIREGPIQNFSLSFDPVKDESTHPEFIDDSYTWIDMLQSRRVLYMKLDFSEYYGTLYGAHDSPKYLLPNKLFKFEFLTVLSLSYCRLQLPIPDGGECFALKSLRLLDLHYVSVTNKEMMEGILPNVPRLMGLTIKKCHELTELHIPYKLLNLKRMLVSSCFRIDKVEAHAPNLDVFIYIGRLIQLSVNKSAPVTNVALRFNSHASDDHIPDGWFLGRPRHDLASIWHMLPLIFPAVVDLRLTVVAPKLASKELSIGVKEHSSTYANLKTLYWPMSTAHRVDFSYLLHILQSCPSLEEIIIRLIELSTGCYLKAKYRDIFHERNQEIWVPPDSEYSVQLGPVKNIIIDGFTAEKNQMELIKFLLHKCSLTLELLTIQPSCDITSWFKATHSVEPHEIHNCYSTAKMELLSTAAKVVSGPFSMKPKVVCLPLDLNLKGH